jgi:hypothetical protein
MARSMRRSMAPELSTWAFSVDFFFALFMLVNKTSPTKKPVRFLRTGL